MNTWDIWLRSTLHHITILCKIPGSMNLDHFSSLEKREQLLRTSKQKSSTHGKQQLLGTLLVLTSSCIKKVLPINQSTTGTNNLSIRENFLKTCSSHLAANPSTLSAENHGHPLRWDSWSKPGAQHPVLCRHPEQQQVQFPWFFPFWIKNLCSFVCQVPSCRFITCTWVCWQRLTGTLR